MKPELVYVVARIGEDGLKSYVTDNHVNWANQKYAATNQKYATVFDPAKARHFAHYLPAERYMRSYVAENLENTMWLEADDTSKEKRVDLSIESFTLQPTTEKYTFSFSIGVQYGKQD